MVNSHHRDKGDVILGTTPLGPAAHATAVRSIRTAFAALPADRPVRLAKATSNLFRGRDRDRGGLDVAGLTGVIAVDPVARTADVQGMCSYETLVRTTLAHNLMPTVVPQLRTITLGGAVTGLGIESSSLRNGLPHEAVVEMDILTGDGEVVTASPTEHRELFEAFPNSYGSLGYALRLRVALDVVQPYVQLRNVAFTGAQQLADAVAEIARSGEWDGVRVDFVDGVMFELDELYLCLGAFASSGSPSDYTGSKIYYRSIRERATDCLGIEDYLWRWDTDWFWCSAAFGVQHRLVRRVWPRRARRSDVYHRIIGLENRYRVMARIEKARGRPDRERVVQDVEVPVGQLASFLDWFATGVAMTPVWLCPLRSAKAWPLYPLEPGSVYVNVGFWGTVPIAAGSSDGDVNRAIEAAVAEHAGHKSLYSDAYYDRETFDALYGGPELARVKARYDPGNRLRTMFDKVITAPPPAPPAPAAPDQSAPAASR